MTLLKPDLRSVRHIVSGLAWAQSREQSKNFSYRSRAGAGFPCVSRRCYRANRKRSANGCRGRQI